MRSRALVPLLLAVSTAAPAAAMTPLAQLMPARTSADSVVAVLHELEAGDRGPRGAAAAWNLGAWHQARGEYGQARAAYLRAAQRLSGPDRHWARIGAARAALALGAPAEAIAAAVDALRAEGGIRAAARMATAQAHEMEGRDVRALDLYERLLSDQPGEMGASALERVAILHDRLKHAAEAEAARARLRREYPASPEAARAPGGPARAGARP